jgi:hypothetical protein
MRYQVIESKIWNDEYFVKLTAMQQRLFLYLLTCPHGNFLGIFVLKPAYAVGDLRISEDEYLKDLKSLSHFMEYDELTDVLWIKNLLRYGTKGKLNDKQKAGAVKLISELPKSELLQHFANYYKPVLGDLSIPQPIGVSNASAYPYGITETETETESKTDTEKETDSENKAVAKEDTKIRDTSLSSVINTSSDSRTGKTSAEEKEKIIKELRDKFWEANDEFQRTFSGESSRKLKKAVIDLDEARQL